MTVELFLIVAGGAALAGFVQGLSGFGFSMTAMALWAWTLEPRLAAALGVFGSLTGQLLAAATVRRGWDWKRVAPFVVGGLAGLPLGLWLLPQLDMPLFKALLGSLMVVLCPLMFVAARLPRIQRGGRVADGMAGAVGGAMSGLGGFSGIVPTLWCQLRGYAKDEQRAVIQNFNLSMQVVTFGSYLATGLADAGMVPHFLVVAPAMLIPGLLGARLYVGLSEQGFRQLVLGLLTLAGIALLASSLPQLLLRA